MKKIILLIALITIHFSSFSQIKYNLEINPFIRSDRYKEFVGWHTGAGGNHYVKLSGVSYGINFNLIRRIATKNSLYLGIGYYRHTISNIKSHSDLGEGKARLINFPSPLFILFYSDTYAYNTGVVNLGYEIKFKILRSYLSTALDVNSLYTFSQYYHLTHNPEGSQDYRKSKASFFGILGGIDIGYIRNYNQFDIGPKLKLPIFSRLKKDSTFPNESDDDHRSQWFSGIGLGISFTYKIKASKQ